MQNRKARNLKTNTKTATEHSTFELYLHGLGAIIGLGILVLPFLVIALYGAVSIYLLIAAGFIALLIGMLIYDISLKYKAEPYSFLREQWVKNTHLYTVSCL